MLAVLPGKTRPGSPTAGEKGRRLVARFVAIALSAVTIGGVAMAASPPASADAPYAAVAGSGSTWSEIMISQWVRDVRKNGLPVNYTGNGSSSGRSDYWNGLNDFAVSEIPFQPRIPGSNDTDELPLAARRPYAYLPIVAGGTSFMYHLTVAGKQVTNLRLSGETLTKIFTGVITNWSDPAITADNGRQLPDKAITPVLRSDGSGTSAQFTLYMSKQYPGLWADFCRKYAGFSGNCGLQSFYPTFPGAKGQALSSGVANYVAAPYGEGAITYVEYSYAQRSGFPVASILNAGGYYVQPTAGNVAVALTQAKINTDLTQNLDGVYVYNDPRVYPVSSYSYMIVPTAEVGRFTADKGRTLTTFMSYFLCAGQEKAENLGFSPLPVNLVQAGFDQMNRIPGHIAPPTLASCNNPALQVLNTAPRPPDCAKVGAAACTSTTAGTPSGSGSTSGTGSSSGTGSTSGTGSGSGSGSGSGTGSGSGDTSGGDGSGGSGTGTGGDSANGTGSAAGTGTTIDPETGQVVTATGGNTSSGSNGSGGGDISAAPVSVSSLRQGGHQANVLFVFAGLTVLAAFFVPPLLSAHLRRRSPSA